MALTTSVTVAKREIKAYFNSPVAYIVVTVFMLLAGYLYWSQLFLEKQTELRYYFSLTPFISVTSFIVFYSTFFIGKDFIFTDPERRTQGTQGFGRRHHCHGVTIHG